VAAHFARDCHAMRVMYDLFVVDALPSRTTASLTLPALHTRHLLHRLGTVTRIPIATCGNSSLAGDKVVSRLQARRLVSLSPSHIVLSQNSV
jgi:hypothetical protein